MIRFESLIVPESIPIQTRTANFLHFFAVCLFLAGAVPVAAQNTDDTSADSLWSIELPVMVVTATKTPTSLRDVPVPTRVVMADEIHEQGALRLSDLLGEHSGLVLTHDFGAGIQIQGFDSAYSLLLIDGEPVIGRTAGTMDLDRIPVGDIDRVEIVEGPSSSLYGSEALAGVINVVTKTPDRPLSLTSGFRIESHTTTDVNTGIEISGARGGLRVNYNRYGTSGYDLSPDVIGLTAPGFQNHTASSRATYELRDNLSLDLSSRFSQQNQSNTIGFDQAGTTLSFEEKATRKDWSISPSLTWRWIPAVRFIFRGHGADYRNDSDFDNSDGPSSIRYWQSYRKGEVQSDIILNTKILINVGGGYIQESVRADRVAGGLRRSNNIYAFLQHQWFASPKLEVNASARFDAHSDYDSRLSPKLALLWRPAEAWRVRGSVGTGFKAPTFQQLYMDFTNPVAGYSVIGSSDIPTAIKRFQDSGQIQYFLTDPSTFTSIRPENSVSWNFAVEFAPRRGFSAELRLFRNNVRDLIETLPVAAKPNGQNIFTYTNLNRIYTQGINAEIRFQPLQRWSVSLGYQFLDAKDRNVLDDLKAGHLFTRENGVDRRLERSEYGGLFNRSRHSGVLRITYLDSASGMSATVRGIYRNRYGFGDLNGNLILDSDAEYVSGYTLWNATVSRPVSESLSVQGGVRNLFAVTNPEFIPSLAGRLFFAGVNVRL